MVQNQINSPTLLIVKAPITVANNNSHDSSNSNNNNKIRNAIDLLLTSESVKVTDCSIQLTRCSPDIDVVMNKQGGICTKCNLMFKSRISLLSHLERCNYFDAQTESNKTESNKVTNY